MSDDLPTVDGAAGATVLVPDVLIGRRARVTFAIEAGSDDPIAEWVLTQHSLDEQPIQLAVDLLRPGDRVLDVGAHIGTYSLAAAALGCSVIAVEGSTANARLLGRARDANGFWDLQVLHAVASDANGEVAFIEHGPWGHLPLPGGGDRELRRRTRAVRLTDAITERGWDGVDFVKMDIEGSEPAALRGLGDLLRRSDRPLLVVESNAPMLRHFGASPHELKRFLEDCGYELYLIDRYHPRQLIRVHPDDLQVEAVVDYFACTTLPSGQLTKWSIVDGFDQRSVVNYLAVACADRHASNRAYAASILGNARDEIRNDSELTPVWKALKLDVDPTVRTSLVVSEPRDDHRRTVRRRRGVVETGRPPRAWPVFKVLARRDLVVRYHRSLLGMWWAVLGPLLTVGALWVVLSQVFKAPRFGVPYIVYLLSGMCVLQLGTQVVQQVGSCLVASEALRTKIRISPRVVALAGTTSVALYSTVLVGALFGVQLITGVGIPVSALLTIPVLGLLLLSAVGVGMLVAALAVRVNDVLSALTVAISIAGYATPTFYPIDVLPQPYRRLVELNPMTHFLRVVRATAYQGVLGPRSSWIVIGATTAFSFGLGMWAFGRSARFSVTRR